MATMSQINFEQRLDSNIKTADICLELQIISAEILLADIPLCIDEDDQQQGYTDFLDINYEIYELAESSASLTIDNIEEISKHVEKYTPEFAEFWTSCLIHHALEQ